MVKREQIPAEKILRIFRRDKFTCQYCGKHGVDLEVDHVIPVALGGSNSEVNLITTCRKCNRKKGKRLKVDNLRDTDNPLPREKASTSNHELPSASYWDEVTENVSNVLRYGSKESKYYMYMMLLQAISKVPPEIKNSFSLAGLQLITEITNASVMSVNAAIENVKGV